MPDLSYIQELEFDLPAKLLEELVKLFDCMPAGKLCVSALKQVDEEQGVYQLFKDGELVYIGKTDSDAGLKKRLQRHAMKIRSRLNLDLDTVTFKAIRVYVFTAMDLEALLIKYYKELGTPLDWQHSGFGSNDPGKERDTTKVKETNFDYKYPIDLGTKVSITCSEKAISVADMLSQLKKQLTFNIRFASAAGRSKKPHEELENAHIRFTNSTETVISLLQKAKAAMGPEWQFTALPGYVIIYKERKDYPSGTIIEST